MGNHEGDCPEISVSFKDKHRSPNIRTAMFFYFYLKSKEKSFTK